MRSASSRLYVSALLAGIETIFWLESEAELLAYRRRLETAIDDPLDRAPDTPVTRYVQNGLFRYASHGDPTEQELQLAVGQARAALLDRGIAPRGAFEYELLRVDGVLDRYWIAVNDRHLPRRRFRL